MRVGQIIYDFANEAESPAMGAKVVLGEPRPSLAERERDRVIIAAADGRYGQLYDPNKCAK